MAAGEPYDCGTCARTHGCPFDCFLGHCEGSDGKLEKENDSDNSDEDSDDSDIEDDPILKNY